MNRIVVGYRDSDLPRSRISTCMPLLLSANLPSARWYPFPCGPKRPRAKDFPGLMPGLDAVAHAIGWLGYRTE
jgi:hypothetical protein